MTGAILEHLEISTLSIVDRIAFFVLVFFLLLIWSSKIAGKEKGLGFGLIVLSILIIGLSEEYFFLDAEFLVFLVFLVFVYSVYQGTHVLVSNTLSDYGSSLLSGYLSSLGVFITSSSTNKDFWSKWIFLLGEIKTTLTLSFSSVMNLLAVISTDYCVKLNEGEEKRGILALSLASNARETEVRVSGNWVVSHLKKLPFPKAFF